MIKIIGHIIFIIYLITFMVIRAMYLHRSYNHYAGGSIPPNDVFPIIVLSDNVGIVSAFHTSDK